MPLNHLNLACLSLLTAALSASSALSAPARSIRDFGAVGDGKTLDTAAIQKALDSVAAGGGGAVLIPPGQYLSGSLVLKSHATLHLDAVATLEGSSNPDDYPIVRARWEGLEAVALARRQDGEHERFRGCSHQIFREHGSLMH